MEKASSASPSWKTSSASSRRSAASRRSPPGDRARAEEDAVNEIKIGLLGLGTVGAGVVRILQSHGGELTERAGCRLAIAAIADLDVTRPREGLDITRLPLHADAGRVLDDPEIRVVIELVGGSRPRAPSIRARRPAGR